MELTTQIAQYFLLSLALGMGPFSLLVDTMKTGVGFYKIVLGIVGGCLTLSLGIYFSSHPMISPISALYLLAMAVTLSQFKLHRDQRDGLMWALFITQVVCIATISFLFLGGDLPSYLYFISSMLFLGSITFIMVLGHWYLVTPRLTERPLQKGLKMIWVIMALKIVITAWGVLQAKDFFSNTPALGMGMAFNWLMLVMRVVWGYLIIAFLSYFSWRLVAMRSLQSATGVFYVMTFFIFVGEMISTFLFYRYGLTI